MEEPRKVSKKVKKEKERERERENQQSNMEGDSGGSGGEDYSANGARRKRKKNKRMPGYLKAKQTDYLPFLPCSFYSRGFCPSADKCTFLHIHPDDGVDPRYPKAIPRPREVRQPEKKDSPVSVECRTLLAGRGGGPLKLGDVHSLLPADLRSQMSKTTLKKHLKSFPHIFMVKEDWIVLANPLEGITEGLVTPPSSSASAPLVSPRAKYSLGGPSSVWGVGADHGKVAVDLSPDSSSEDDSSSDSDSVSAQTGPQAEERQRVEGVVAILSVAPSKSMMIRALRTRLVNHPLLGSASEEQVFGLLRRHPTVFAVTSETVTLIMRTPPTSSSSSTTNLNNNPATSASSTAVSTSTTNSSTNALTTTTTNLGMTTNGNTSGNGNTGTAGTNTNTNTNTNMNTNTTNSNPAVFMSSNSMSNHSMMNGELNSPANAGLVGSTSFSHIFGAAGSGGSHFLDTPLKKPSGVALALESESSRPSLFMRHTSSSSLHDSADCFPPNPLDLLPSSFRGMSSPGVGSDGAPDSPAETSLFNKIVHANARPDAMIGNGAGGESQFFGGRGGFGGLEYRAFRPATRTVTQRAIASTAAVPSYYVFVNSNADALIALDEIARFDMVALGFEGGCGIRSEPSSHFVSFAVVSTPTRCYVFDLMASGLDIAGSGLRDFLEGSTVKVVYGISAWARLLLTGLGCFLNFVFDVQLGHKVLGGGSDDSLDNIVQYYTRNSVQFRGPTGEGGPSPNDPASWKLRPLPQLLIQTACDHVTYLLHVHARMTEVLSSEALVRVYYLTRDSLDNSRLN